jgi:hypothetical protein
VSKQIDGFHLGIGGFSIGNISSYTSEIEVCEIKHYSDYKIVSEWINIENKKYVKYVKKS